MKSFLVSFVKQIVSGIDRKCYLSIILDRIACHRKYFALNSEQAFMRPCLATKAARSGLDPGPLLGIIKDRPRNRVCGYCYSPRSSLPFCTCPVL